MRRVFYMDSSAILKFALYEEDISAFINWYNEEVENKAVFVSSELAVTEATRAVRRYHESQLPQLRRFLNTLVLIPIRKVSFDMAADLLPTALRTLDALHVVAAQSIGPQFEAFITYDKRLQDAAKENGLHSYAPHTIRR